MTRGSELTNDQARRIVVAAGLGAFIAKIFVAAHTLGTDDTLFYSQFAAAIRRVGTLRVYELRFIVRYNHPPLLGHLLNFLNWMQGRGFDMHFLIRLPAIVADLGSTILVFEIARRHGSARRALAVSLLVALNPILFIISGYHGNTDPVFVVLLLAALFALREANRPVIAGTLFALSAGIKLVPLIALPAFLASARSRRDSVRMLGGLAATSALIWAPALMRESHAIRERVIGYRGQPSNWGFIEMGNLTGSRHAVISFLDGNVQYLIAAAIVVATVVAVRRNTEFAYGAAGTALLLSLVAPPGFATQYLAWPVVLGCLLDPRWAAAYSFVGAVFIFETYTHWAGKFPWYWSHPAASFDHGGAILGLLTWAVVFAWSAATVISSLRRARQASLG